MRTHPDTTHIITGMQIYDGRTSGKTAELMRQIAEYKRLNPKAVVHVYDPRDDWVDRSNVGIVFPEYELMKRFNAFP